MWRIISYFRGAQSEIYNFLFASCMDFTQKIIILYNFRQIFPSVILMLVRPLRNLYNSRPFFLKGANVGFDAIIIGAGAAGMFCCAGRSGIRSR